MTILLAYVIPIWITLVLCEESFVGTLFGHLQRYCLGLHLTWTINSIAHMWGWKPFDKSISPTEGYTMGFFTLGKLILVVKTIEQLILFQFFYIEFQHPILQVKDGKFSKILGIACCCCLFERFTIYLEMCFFLTCEWT